MFSLMVFLLMVAKGGLEPPRAFAHRLLKPARLPIPPLGQSVMSRALSGSCLPRISAHHLSLLGSPVSADPVLCARGSARRFSSMVRSGGLEPPPPEGDKALNLARLPVPPRPLVVPTCSGRWATFDGGANEGRTRKGREASLVFETSAVASYRLVAPNYRTRPVQSPNKPLIRASRIAGARISHAS